MLQWMLQEGCSILSFTVSSSSLQLSSTLLWISSLHLFSLLSNFPSPSHSHSLSSLLLLTLHESCSSHYCWLHNYHSHTSWIYHSPPRLACPDAVHTLIYCCMSWSWRAQYGNMSKDQNQVLCIKPVLQNRHSWGKIGTGGLAHWP